MMGLWDAFKEGIALRAGLEALGLIPRAIRGFLKWLLIMPAIVATIAFFRAFWPVVLAAFLIYCAWRWGKKRGEYERNGQGE